MLDRRIVAIVATACALAMPDARARDKLEAPPPLRADAPATPAAAKTEEAAKPHTQDSEVELEELPPAQTVNPQTRIEQRRSGNRIVEVTVTPAGSKHSYTIVNREGQRPATVQDLSAGLSTPRFFKFDF